MLAAETGVSIRTLCRDIASLQAQGAAIEGEPGVGYLTRPGFMLPPLMFGQEEIEALVLGMRLVADSGDQQLAQGALSTLAALLDQRYPRHRQALLKEWRRTEFVAGRSILPETDSIAE